MNEADEAALALGLWPKVTVEPEPEAKESAPTGTYAFPFPASFLPFLAYLDVHPTPAQADLFGVICDGQDPRAVEHGPALFGPIVGELGDRPRRRACIVKGRGMGGTFLSSLRMLHLSLTLPLDALAEGEPAYCVFVAPDLATARHAMGFAYGAAMGREAIKSMVTGEDTRDAFEIIRPDGTIRLECKAATKGGAAVRGRTVLGAVYTEYGFFRGETGVVNDADMRRAIEPRIVAGGQLILESTPWVASGELYTFHREEFGRPRNTIVCEAPTALMRPDAPDVLALIAETYANDSDDAAREYGAKFTSSDANLFFNPQAIEGAIDESLVMGRTPKPGTDAAAGADFGFTRNSSALVVTHRTAGVYSAVDVVEIKPQAGSPLKPSETVAEFASVLRAHGLTAVMADQHHRESIREWMTQHGVRLVDAPSQPAEAFVRCRALLNEGKIRLPAHRLLLSQLREVRSRKLPGGGVAMVLPKSPDGRHGDLAAAFVLAVYSRATVGARAPAPARGTPEWQAAELEALHRKTEERVKREHTSGMEAGIFDEGSLFDDD